MSRQEHHLYEFGPFRLDSAEHLLLRHGDPVDVAPKVFDILRVLVENRGRLVSKKELMDSVWPDTFVEENNLTVNISALRKILGEDRYIETIPKFGYRFVPEVSKLPGSRELRPADGARGVQITDEGRSAKGSQAASEKRQRGDQPRIPSKVKMAAFFGIVAIISALALFALFFTNSPLSVRTRVNSLVVLPLENLSGDPAREYFADGVTDSLIGELAKIRALRVISRTSAMSYKGARQAIPQIGRELNVDAVIEGTIHLSGDRLRVRVQLIDAAADHHLWSQTYDRDLSDILNLQSEIARAVASEISAQVEPDEQSRLAVSQSVNRKAFDHYLLGKHHLRNASKEQIYTAIEHFENSIDEDPTYAPAHIGLAHCYSALGKVMHGGMPPMLAASKAAEASRRALEIDGQLPDAHAVLGEVSHYSWEWAEAERRFQRAIDLNPSDPRARSGYAMYLSTLGRTEEALAEIRRARQLDPHSVFLRWTTAMIAYQSRHYDEAMEALQGIIEMSPGFEHSYWTLGLSYLAKGMNVEAIELLEKARVRFEGQLSILSVLGMAYGRAGRKAEATTLLKELTERSRQEYVPAGNFLDIHLGLGNEDEAFFWLEKAYEERSHYVTHLKVLPEVDSIRGDPRFNDLLRRIGLESL